MRAPKSSTVIGFDLCRILPPPPIHSNIALTVVSESFNGFGIPYGWDLNGATLKRPIYRMGAGIEEGWLEDEWRKFSNSFGDVVVEG